MKPPARKPNRASQGSAAEGRRHTAAPPTGAAPRDRWPVVLAVLFVIAFAWRAAYLIRLAASPLGGSLSEDSIIYWRWAGVLLDRGLWGRHPFFLGPLYPYALAALRVVVGNSVHAVLVIQALWGAAAAALLADAARRLTRPAIGVAVGAAIAFHEMAVFFDGLVLMESLLFFLEALLIWWVVSGAWQSGRATALATLGALIGSITEARATSALLLLPALLLVARRQGLGGRAATARVGLVLAGFAVVTLPVAVRNFAVGGEWIPFTYNGGVYPFVGKKTQAAGAFSHPTRTHT